MHKIKKLVLVSILFIIFGLSIFSFSTLQTEAGFIHSLRDWLWGGGTGVVGDGTHTNVGHISVNNLNCDPDNDGVTEGGVANNPAYPNCPDGQPVSNYGISVPFTDSFLEGDVSGYAWSENIGWISFNEADLVGCPGPIGVGNVNRCVARREDVGGADDRLRGWARILGIRDASLINNSGAWAGWIKLASEPGDLGASYRVSIVGNAVNGFAWSDELGWIEFNANLVVPMALKICQNSCDSGLAVANNSSLIMVQGSTKNLKACFNDVDGCTNNTGDVTDDPNTNWNANDNPDNVVSLTNTVPKGILAADQSNTGRENIIVTYIDPLNANVNTVNFNAVVYDFGVCNAAVDGGTFCSVPNNNLCTLGTPTPVTYDASNNTWNWQCRGPVFSLSPPTDCSAIKRCRYKEVAP